MTLSNVVNSRVVKYFREAKMELEKVSWPTRKDTVMYSILVAVISVGTAIVIGALDFGLSQGLEALIRVLPI